VSAVLDEAVSPLYFVSQIEDVTMESDREDAGVAGSGKFQVWRKRAVGSFS